MNVGGIGSKVTKRHRVFNSVKTTCDITILTETKFKADQIQGLKQEWHGMSVHSVAQSQNARSGVSILFKRGLAFKPIDQGDDGEGRIVWAEVEISSKKLLIIGVYAPSDKDDPEFFEKLFGMVEGRNYDHLVISGDFNVGLDENLDYKGYTSKAPRPKSRSTIVRCLKQYGICDTFRERNPNKVENTWQKWDRLQARNIQQARLDYFLVDNELRSFIELVGAAEPFNPEYDHRAILLKVDFCKVQRGAGYWKMNNALLDEPEYIDMVNSTIIRVVHDYQAIKPGVALLSKPQIRAMTPEERGKIDMSLNAHQFLEFLLFSIKGETRKYGAKRQQNLRWKIEELEAELLKLKETTDIAEQYNVHTGHSFTSLEEKQKAAALEQASAKRKEKEKLEAHINQGAYVRTGQHWKCESEQGSKLFFQQEKWRGDQRYLGVLEVDSGIGDGSTKLIESQPEIEEEIHRFYKELYRHRQAETSREDIREFMGEGFEHFENICGKKLPITVQEKLQEPISQDEVMQALQKGQHGKAPGITGFTREFYKKFAEDLIAPIMKYIDFAENTGQLSEQQRQGVITLLPKGKKSKMALKNWRPITLLTTLYKIISGTIAARVKKVLPHIIGEDQKGFVDGRYMGEVTRTLYDTIHDAWHHQKKGVLLSIDFEKAFDSLSHDFVMQVMEVAGFGSRLKKWVKVLLSDFSSRVNHVGNLLKSIDLGRGARQGDPIASLLFVLCIEILLVAIRSNPRIEPYTFFKGLSHETITSKTEAFADDVTLTLPYKETSLREAITMFNNFSKISGLTLNQGKTQVMVIGKQTDPSVKLAPDLGLNWVNEITILGIKLYPDPEQMISNFDDKVDDIKQLLNRWTFRNLTVFGRIQIVKSLGLSKLTHVVQIVPNPPILIIKDLQRKVNDFIWEGGKQKKHVVNERRAQQPLCKGGLAVPNINDFWDGLKCTWLHRLAEAPDSAKWKRLALRDLRGALRKPHFSCANMVDESPLAIAEASKQISNRFWSPIWEKLPTLVNAHNKLTWEPQFLAEKLLWGTSSFLNEAGDPLNTREFRPAVARLFRTVGDVVLKGEVKEDKVKQLSSEIEIDQFKVLLGAIDCYLVKVKKTWLGITQSTHGPHHHGWSRLLTSLKRSREVYKLIQYDKHNGDTRNENEIKWLNETTIQTMSESRWEHVYKNLSRLKCNLRIKYEEWRIAWGRQELNRDKIHYPGCSTQSTKCSYCTSSVETEVHLYTSCEALANFWGEARKWTFLNLGVCAPLNLKCNRIFGMEKEKPDDLLNVFYRNARYAIYRNRETSHPPNLDLFEDLMLDDLRRKYAGKRIEKYKNDLEEQPAIGWFQRKLDLDPILAIG